MIVATRCFDLRRAETPVTGIQPLNSMDMRSTKRQSIFIDLMAAELDPRVTYTGPAHLYWSAAGLLETAPENVWPVAHVDGVPAGRHEPEPPAINLQPNARASVLSDNVVTSGDLIFEADATGAPDGGAIARIPADMGEYHLSQDISGVILVPRTFYTLSDKWARLAYAVTSTARSRLRLRLGMSATASLWLTQNAAYASWPVADNYAVSWFVRRDSDSTFLAGIGQLERGALATSPIITEGAANGIRAESAVSVDVTGGYSLLAVHFSDGTAETHALSGDHYSLPFASGHWGTRYIRKLELIK